MRRLSAHLVQTAENMDSLQAPPKHLPQGRFCFACAWPFLDSGLPAISFTLLTGAVFWQLTQRTQLFHRASACANLASAARCRRPANPTVTSSAARKPQAKGGGHTTGSRCSARPGEPDQHEGDEEHMPSDPNLLCIVCEAPHRLTHKYGGKGIHHNHYNAIRAFQRIAGRNELLRTQVVLVFALPPAR